MAQVCAIFTPATSTQLRRWTWSDGFGEN